MTVIARLSRVAFIRFAMVGCFGYLIDTGILWLATSRLGLDPYSGRVVSIFVAMFFTLLGNRYLTFSTRAARNSMRAVAKEWAKFVAANMLGAVVNYVVYAFLVHSGPAPLDDKYLAQACGVLVGMLFNFFLSKHFVFSSPKT